VKSKNRKPAFDAQAAIEAAIVDGDKGRLDAAPSVLTLLFALAAPHVEGERKKTCESLHEWFRAEAEIEAGLERSVAS
jgi:hypothetical protein